MTDNIVINKKIHGGRDEIDWGDFHDQFCRPLWRDVVSGYVIATDSRFVLAAIDHEVDAVLDIPQAAMIRRTVVALMSTPTPDAWPRQWVAEWSDSIRGFVVRVRDRLFDLQFIDRAYYLPRPLSYGIAYGIAGSGINDAILVVRGNGFVFGVMQVLRAPAVGDCVY